MAIVIREPGVLRSLKGDVREVDESPVKGALVEVFDEPGYLIDPTPRDRRGHGGQRRIAACRTDETGRFCLAGIPAGPHELRVSHAELTGWNVSQYYVVLDPKSMTASDRAIHVRLEVAN